MNAVELVELIGLRERIEKRLVGVLPSKHRVNAVMTIGAEFNQLLLTTSRGPQNGNGAAARDGGASPSVAGGPVATGAAPLPCTTRPFKLIRLVDHSGVSGTGNVAEGVQFSDGSVAIRWHGHHPSTAVWPSIADVLVVHGHGGDTVLRWLDEAVSDV